MDQNQNQYQYSPTQVPAPQAQPTQQPAPAVPQYQQQPVQPQPNYAPQGLTGGQKAAWLFIGMFASVAGILLAAVTNLDNPARKSEALKFAAIGFVIILVIYVLIFAMAGCSTAAMLGSSGYYSYR